MSKNFLGNAIKYLRKQRGMRQEDLSKLTGLKQNTISNHENDRSTINELDIKKYVKAFKISSVEFFEIAEDLHDGVDPKEKRQDVLQTTPIIKIGKIVNGATGTAIEENSLFENFIGDYQNEDYFCLDVESDELKNDNILKKDIVLIKKSESLEYNGQICIVQMENSTLLTHVYKHNPDIILQSSDLSISPIVFKENETKKFKILGTLKGIQRNY